MNFIPTPGSEEGWAFVDPRELEDSTLEIYTYEHPAAGVLPRSHYALVRNTATNRAYYVEYDNEQYRVVLVKGEWSNAEQRWTQEPVIFESRSRASVLAEIQQYDDEISRLEREVAHLNETCGTWGLDHAEYTNCPDPSECAYPGIRNLAAAQELRDRVEDRLRNKLLNSARYQPTRLYWTARLEYRSDEIRRSFESGVGR